MAERAEIRLPETTRSWLQLVMLILSVGQILQLISLQEKEHNSQEEYRFLQPVKF